MTAPLVVVGDAMLDIDLTAGFPPVSPPGRYLAHFDLVDAQPIELLTADFVQYGSEPLIVDVIVH